MSRYVDCYTAANEAEADALCEFLREQGIDAEKVALNFSAYPGIGYPGWGAVRVPEGDLERAKQFLTEWVQAGDAVEPEPPEPELPRARIKKEAARAPIDLGSSHDRAMRSVRVGGRVAFYALFAASLATNLVLYHKLRTHPTEVEIFSVDGHLLSRFTYHEETSPFPYQVEAFAKDGRPVDAYFDENENGFYEIGYIAGQKEPAMYDRNENGVIERAELYQSGNGKPLVLLDEDEDGWFDRAICDQKQLKLLSLCE